MDLTFAGDLGPWQGGVLALAAAWLAWRLYRRERFAISRTGAVRYVLPILRCAAIGAVILCLTGPVITRRQEEGRLGRVVVVVDGSESMGVQDDHLDSGRKLLVAAAKAGLPDGTVDRKLLGLTQALGRARRLAAGPSPQSRVEARGRRARALLAEIERAASLVREIDPSRLPDAAPARGFVTVEYFDGVAVSKLADLASGTALDRKPSASERRDALESARNRGDTYGTRIRGYLLPPVSGPYTFWISGDDDCQLSVSPSADPGGARPVARVEGYAPYGAWEGSPSQRSSPLALSAGERYFFEVLHKEGSGDDFVAVGWQRPDGKVERPIPGACLGPFDAAPPRDARATMALARLFDEEVVTPARELAGRMDRRDIPAAAEPAAREAGARELSASLGRWEDRFAGAFTAYASSAIRSGPPALGAAIREFDALARWKRAEAIVLDPTAGLVSRLAETHRVELVVLAEHAARRAWSSEAPADPPEVLPGEPAGKLTDLGDPIKELCAKAGGERAAVVLLSDGRHNDGNSPQATAKLLGTSGIPLFAVGLGNHRDPADVAVLRVEAPDSVYADDRVTGRAVLRDHMPAGIPFSLAIRSGGREVWKKELATAGGGERSIDFDFSVKELADARGREARRDVELFSLPLGFQVAVESLAGEARADNNAAPLNLRVVTQGRSILLVDGRPRWETRYVRNLFDRDKQWKIDDLIADPLGGEGAWATGEGRCSFPRDRETLYRYGCIIFGEVPPGMLKAEELGWIRDFVERRGGGIIFIDGRRGILGRYEESPLRDLFPVQRLDGGGAPQGLAPDRLELAELGRGVAALRLDRDPEANDALWRMLPRPNWIAPVRALPGTETYVEAVRGAERFPAVVGRRFGAGAVLHCAFDSSWRWRYEVADRYHTRYWNQIVSWIMESPFAVKDTYVALDAGGPAYAAGDAAAIRARLQGRDGLPLLDATCEAIICRDGKAIATVALEPDPNRGGIYRGATAPLEPGAYEVGVQIEGFSDLEMKARATFAVEPRAARELAELTCDEELLRDMAEASGGAYLREEDAAELPTLLAPLSEGKIVESEIRLAQSYWWFVPIVLLLTAEWILRKRSGLL